MLKHAVVAAILATLSTQSPAFCPTRHFYNNSKYPFTVTMIQGACSIGASGIQKSCVAPGGQTINLHYTNQIFFDGFISFSSPIFADTREFHVQTGDCHIDHQDRPDTGNVVLNSPIDGDVTTCGGSGYACIVN